MKKKLAMRVASLALCVVFTGMLFGAPKAKAVVTETAIGTAAVASYFQATGLTMAASAGSTGALITTGVADIAGSYAMATGAASSGSAFLSSLAAGVSISPAGALVLTAAAVVAIGALVAWYIGENGLEAEGDTVVAMPGTSDFCSYNRVELPNIDTVWMDKVTYPDCLIVFTSGSVIAELHIGTFSTARSTTYGPSVYFDYSVSDRLVYRLYSGSSEWEFFSNYQSGRVGTSGIYPCWVSKPVYYDSGDLAVSVGTTSSVGDVSDQLEVTRSPEFAQPDVDFTPESQKQMVINAGLAPGTTLDTAVEQVLELINAGDFAPTYEIITEGTGEETDTETKPDEESGVYIPILSDIKTALSNLGTSIVDGVKGLFVPTNAVLDSLSAEVDNKLPFIPDLKAFGSDLAYNLEHPEECVDEMGFTTIVDLGKGRGAELGNARIDLLDVSWYLEYKPFVDDVIVGFVWLMFLWNLYGELPRIIHGEGSLAKMYSIVESSRKENDL